MINGNTISIALFILALILLWIALASIMRFQRNTFLSVYGKVLRMEKVIGPGAWIGGDIANLMIAGIRVPSPKIGEDHSLDCVDQQMYLWYRTKLWEMRWPGFCRKCRGSGVQIFRSEFGAEAEPCNECTEAGKCARCGHRHQQYPILGWFGDVLWNLGKSIRGDQHYLAKTRSYRIGVWFQRKGDRLVSQAIGKSDWFEDENPCKECGWNWGHDTEDQCYEVMEGPCNCDFERWEREDAEQRRATQGT
jgi:hypothetical protein